MKIRLFHLVAAIATLACAGRAQAGLHGAVVIGVGPVWGGPPYPYPYPYYYPYYPPPPPVYQGRPIGDDSIAVPVQQELGRRGFYHGPVDGVVGPGTRAAIAAYQRNKGLEVTGNIDGVLLRSLHIYQ